MSTACAHTRTQAKLVALRMSRTIYFVSSLLLPFGAVILSDSQWLLVPLLLTVFCHQLIFKQKLAEGSMALQSLIRMEVTGSTRIVISLTWPRSCGSKRLTVGVCKALGYLLCIFSGYLFRVQFYLPWYNFFSDICSKHISWQSLLY